MHFVSRSFIAMSVACLCFAAWGQSPAYYDLNVGGEPWLRTMIAPYDDSSDASREATYKVYTQMFDFDGKGFITKGTGGKYPHHRGLFIGWKDTLVSGEDYDTWHMTNCYQEHVNWIYRKNADTGAMQSEVVEWRDLDDETFIREVRTILASKKDGLRVIDFLSELTAEGTDVELKGDLQHAGMQVRMANEVSEHEGTTEYTLPEGAEELDDDKVVGAWWMLGSFEVGGQRYWVVHMTPADHPTGQPVYSIRRYGRFGAFWETGLKAGSPAEYAFRVVVSDRPLDRAQCEGLYADYNASREPVVSYR